MGDKLRGGTTIGGNIAYHAGNIPTWNQDTTGNAGTATTATTAIKLTNSSGDWAASGAIANVVGMLAWKYYSNGHVIVDASAGTAPNGAAISNVNAAIPWSASYPTLMGWNGASTYGVRVDSARVADSASYATTAAVGTNTTVIATTAFVNAEIANDTYSKTQLDAGQLDNRYYTEAEVDSKLASHYATATVGGIIKVRYDNVTQTLYIRTDGTDA